MAADRKNFIFFLCPLDGVRFILPEVHFSELPIVIGFGNFAELDLSYSHSGNSAEKFPPAGGIGDWGEPQ